MINKLKPVIVLTSITTIISLLLIVTHAFTYVDTSNMITDKLMSACIEAMGEGEFEIVSDWKAEGYAVDKPENIEKMIKKSDGTISFEIITNGYSKKGIDVLIAMNDDGSIKAISVVSLGETPGLGTKVQNEDFLLQYSGKTGEVELVKHAPSADNEVQAVTGATYSSTGVTEAINIALSVYPELGIQN